MTLPEIQESVTSFSRQELRHFSRWFHEHVADEWDRQIEEDAKSGRLEALYQRVQKENRGQPNVPLEEVLNEIDATDDDGRRVAEESPVETVAPGFSSGRVEQLQEQIKVLTPPEFGAFVEWFEEYLEDEWDRQIEEDERAGRLDAVGERAIKDFEEGRYTQL
jgi:hypothetical protein